MTYSDEPKSSPAMPLFLLGQADASISFLRLLPESVATKATSVLAFRLLDSLWQQYRIDCRINHGRTLLSVDNGYELRVFATLIDELATWPPLLDANAVIRTHAPALLADEARLFENECEVRRDIVTEICDQIGCFPAGLDPIKASGLLIDRCQKLEEQHEFGICWALNLLGANRLDVLGRSKSCPPFPSLFRREMQRFDRSRAWREDALRNALAKAAHNVSAQLFASVHAVQAFALAFPALRRNSRLELAFIYLVGIGDLTPTLLAHLVGCSEPGARKMLRQLADSGLAVHSPPSPSFKRVPGFRLGWPSAPWLRSNSMLESQVAELFNDA